MKTTKVLVAAFLFAGFASLSFAGPGAQYFTRRLQTGKDVDALPANTPIAMACMKCKTITLVTPAASRRVFFTSQKHECPGCHGEITTTIGKNDKMTHTCSKCGDESVFCCATSADAAPMPGM